MPRINEHIFELNNEEYLLTWYDKPRLTKNGIEQKVLPILSQYIRANNLPIQLINCNGNNEVTHTLSKKILQHFSENTSTTKKRTQAKEKKEPKKKIELVKSVTNNEELALSANFKVIMVCAGSKNDSFFTAYPEVNFVNESSPNNTEHHHHPDDMMRDAKISWREYLINNQNDINLLEAYNLYKRNEYRCLYNRFKERFYILSAGWGLVKADCKLPNYDITFSKLAENKNKRIFNDEGYRDFNKLENISDSDDIVFIGSPDYIPLFFDLTRNLKNRKIIYWKRHNIPNIYPVPNNTFLYRFYETNARNNWYYAVANDFCSSFTPN